MLTARCAVHTMSGAFDQASALIARVLTLDHWLVDADSITRHGRDGAQRPLDALDFFIELRGALGLSDDILPVYLEEISSTLSGTAYKLAAEPVGAAQLAKSGFQEIETGMTEGHPCFLANNGRLGFGIHEYLSYAPETASPVQLVWLAAHRDHSTFTSSPDLDYDALVRASAVFSEPVPPWHITMSASRR